MMERMENESDGNSKREALINECDFVKGELLNIYFDKKDEGKMLPYCEPFRLNQRL